jgi:hypothetical protein
MALRVRPALPVLAVALALAAAATVARAASPAEQTKATKSYVFTLAIGMPEQMWTPAQVRSKHPAGGEVMLKGSMKPGMKMGGSQRHLEVHVRRRSNGRVVVGASPVISVYDTDPKTPMLMYVTVAEMRGVDAGVSDTHYGNNVQLVPGHGYRVTVILNGERVVFRVTV